MYSNIHLQNLNQMISFSNGNILKIIDDYSIKCETESIFYNDFSETTINKILEIYITSFNHYLNIINLILDSSFYKINSLDFSEIYSISENCHNIIFLLRKGNEGYTKFFRWCVEKKITIPEKYTNKIKLLLKELLECGDLINEFENFKNIQDLNDNKINYDIKETYLSRIFNYYNDNTIILMIVNNLLNIKNHILNFLFQEE
jgi:hypothetical protein